MPPVIYLQLVPTSHPQFISLADQHDRLWLHATMFCFKLYSFLSTKRGFNSVMAPWQLYDPPCYCWNQKLTS